MKNISIKNCLRVRDNIKYLFHIGYSRSGIYGLPSILTKVYENFEGRHCIA